MGRSQAGGGSVMIWAMFCWETFAPAIYVDVTLTCNTNLKIADTLSWKQCSPMVWPLSAG